MSYGDGVHMCTLMLISRFLITMWLSIVVVKRVGLTTKNIGGSGGGGGGGGGGSSSGSR